MLFELPLVTSRPIGKIAGSVACHVAVLAALLHAGKEVRYRATLPGTLQGTKIELSYLPGGATTRAAVIRKKAVPAAVTKSLPKLEPPPAESPAIREVASPAPGSSGSQSNDALGNEDIQIALTTYSPSPKPDLSRVPRGTQGDVVIDITIDPTGKVADLHILQALGYGVEGAVADAVRAWKFRPAIKDGVPVASVQELHFHYGPV